MKIIQALVLSSTLILSLPAHAASSEAIEESQATNPIKKYGYDRPLLVNLEDFRKVARKELTERFGKIADDGEIIHKDMVGANGASFWDMNRLYYITEVEIDPRITNSEGLYAAYMITTQGYQALGYARISTNPRRDVSWLFAAYAIGYKDIFTDELNEYGDPIPDKAKQKEVLESAVAHYTKAFPALTFSPVYFINTFFAEVPDEHILNPTAEELQALGAFLSATRKDANIKYIEIEPEHANFFPADHITSLGDQSQEIIDLNALRSISLTFLESGYTPVDGLVPFLPPPFAINF